MDDLQRQVKPLPEGFKRRAPPENEFAEKKLPEGFTRRKPPENEPIQEEYPDYDPSLEHPGSYETLGQIGKGLLSGATAGISTHAPGLGYENPEETSNPLATKLARGAGEAVGSLVPLTPALKFMSSSVAKIAAKSPYMKKTVESFLNLLGVGVVGGVHHGATETIKGNEVTLDDVLEHGATWVAIDAGLGLLGLTARAGKAVYDVATSAGVAEKEIVKEAVEILQHFNIDKSDKETMGKAFDEIMQLSKEAKMTPQEFIKSQETALSESGFPIPKKQMSKVPKEAEFASVEKIETAPSDVSKKNLEDFAQKALKPIEFKFSEKPIEIAQKELSKEPITPKDLKERYIEPKNSPIEELTKEAPQIAEPRQPESKNFIQESEDIQDNFLNKRIDKSGPEVDTRRELGGRVKADVNATIKAQKEEYKPLYEEAKKEAYQIYSDAPETGLMGGEIYLELEPPSTRPKEYGETIKATETALEDAGFKIEVDKETGATKIYSTGEVPVSSLMELGKRLGEIINFDSINPSVKNILKKLQVAVKTDVKVALRDHEDVLTAYELAEEAHAKLAAKVDKPTINKVRTTHEGERIASIIEEPSTFHDLQELLSPKQMAVVEKELLKKLKKSPYETAKEILREFEKSLTPSNAQLAKDIVASKNPVGHTNRNEAVQKAILDDLSNAFTIGERPEYALKLWQTTKGQRLIKEVMFGSPNAKAVERYLSEQSFSDMVASVVDKKTGKVSINKLNQFLEQPGVISNIRMIGGEGAASFFSNLESKLLRFQYNAKLLEKLPSKSELTKGQDLIYKTKLKNKERIQKAITEQKKAFEEEKGRLTKIVEEEKEAFQTKRNQEKNRFEQLKEKGKQVSEGKSKYGEHKLRRTKEKNKALQEKIAQKKKPKIEKALELAKEMLGFSPQAMLTVFSAMKFGVPKATSAIIAYNLFKILAKNPSARKIFTEASRKGIDTMTFIIAIEKLGELIDEE